MGSFILTTENIIQISSREFETFKPYQSENASQKRFAVHNTTIQLLRPQASPSFWAPCPGIVWDRWARYPKSRGIVVDSLPSH